MLCLVTVAHWQALEGGGEQKSTAVVTDTQMFQTLSLDFLIFFFKYVDQVLWTANDNCDWVGESEGI